jgi:uncharacterized protein YecT (DUF1311 family)
MRAIVTPSLRLAVLSALAIMPTITASYGQATVQERDIACPEGGDRAQAPTICAELAWKKADADLTRTYQQTLTALATNGAAPSPQLDGDPRQQLEQAQQLWTRFVELDCQLYQGVSGGGNTGHFNYLYQCRLDRTLKRIAELQGLNRMSASR